MAVRRYVSQLEIYYLIRYVQPALRGDSGVPGPGRRTEAARSGPR